eukprot:1145666-Amphidinium_carterae.1
MQDKTATCTYNVAGVRVCENMPQEKQPSWAWWMMRIQPLGEWVQMVLWCRLKHQVPVLCTNGASLWQRKNLQAHLGGCCVHSHDHGVNLSSRVHHTLEARFLREVSLSH